MTPRQDPAGTAWLDAAVPAADRALFEQRMGGGGHPVPAGWETTPPVLVVVDASTPSRAAIAAMQHFPCGRAVAVVVEGPGDTRRRVGVEVLCCPEAVADVVVAGAVESHETPAGGPGRLAARSGQVDGTVCTDQGLLRLIAFVAGARVGDRIGVIDETMADVETLVGFFDSVTANTRPLMADVLVAVATMDARMNYVDRSGPFDLASYLDTTRAVVEDHDRT